jgi:hypothetical protein
VRRRRSWRPRGGAWLVRPGVRRWARLGAGFSALLLVVSVLSVNALTAGIQIAPTAFGPPEHRFADDGQVLPAGVQSRRDAIPRAAFERVRPIPVGGPPAFGGDRVYDIAVGDRSYRVHEFRSVGTSTLTVARPIDLEYLVVGGGASGTRGQCSVYFGHGGGGGGVARGVVALVPQDVSITVGAGGQGADSQSCNVAHTGNAGGASRIVHATTIEANGGLGATWNQAPGGASGTVTVDGVTSAGQLGGVGRGVAFRFESGGGGGAGGAGSGRDGGPGVDADITGRLVTYGAGGAGRDSDGFGAPGAIPAGIGGGGSDGLPGSVGARFEPGGSGIVIVRYEIPRTVWAPVAGIVGDSSTIVTIDGLRHREHRFTSTGSRTLTVAMEHPAMQLEVLLVGGGGGGGIDSGGGGGGGALLEGRVTFTEAGERTMTVTVGGGGSRGRWTSPREFGGPGGDSRILVTSGGASEVDAVAGGGRGGPTNDQNAINTNNGANTGKGGVVPSVPALGAAAWQGLTARAGGDGGGPSAVGYATNADGKPAPPGGGQASLFGGIYGGGAGGGSSGRTVTAAGTNGGGRGSGANTSVLDCQLRATAGAANSGGGGGAGAAYGPSGPCGGLGGLNTRDAEPGGAGIVIIRYPLDRLVETLPSRIRDAVAGEGATSAVLRWREPASAAPPASALGYRIEYAAVGAGTWDPLPSGAASFTKSGDLVTATVTGIASTSRHLFRITPVGTVDGPPTVVEPVAKGGDTVTLVGGDVVHTYTTVGSTDLLLSSGRTVEYLIVGGGGAGGSVALGSSGGGGGGRVLQGRVSSGTALALSASTGHRVTVAAGGTPSAVDTVPTVPASGDGGSSSFAPATGAALTALGGGGGANSRQYLATQGVGSTTGWTGGGGSVHAGTASAGSTGVGGAGVRGGNAHPDGGFADPQAAGGGGGAGAAGANAVASTGGKGGDGVSSDISGTVTRFGGGGGGGKRTSTGSAGAGGLGGGGAGGRHNTRGQDGAANTGGGGGGSGEGSSAGAHRVGGAGGSGIVILRYPFAPSS